MKGAGLIILTGGLGGGTASGAMPVLARAALSSGAEVLAVVTLPAIQEGRKRQRQATAALAELHQIVKRVETVPLLVGSTWSVETFKSTHKVANHILDVRRAWFVGKSWT